MILFIMKIVEIWLIMCDILRRIGKKGLDSYKYELFLIMLIYFRGMRILLGLE